MLLPDRLVVALHSFNSCASLPATAAVAAYSRTGDACCTSARVPMSHVCMCVLDDPSVLTRPGAQEGVLRAPEPPPPPGHACNTTLPPLRACAGELAAALSGDLVAMVRRWWRAMTRC